MSRKLTKSGKTFFQNTMRMVNFTNRLKEENMMWKKFDKIKKRKLCESDDEGDRQSTDLTYENRYFREKDESMNGSSQMDISMHESNNLSNLRHLNESDVKVKKLKTPSKREASKSKTPSKRTPGKRTPSKSKTAKKKDDDDETSDSESSSEDEECMVDSSFSSADERLIKTPKKSRTPLAEKKIKKREKFLKKQLDKLKKKDKKDKKSKKKKSKKHKS